MIQALPLFLTKCEKQLTECRKFIANSAIKGNFSVDCEVDIRCRDSFFKELHKDKYKLDYEGWKQAWSWDGGDNPIYEKVRVSWSKN